MDFPYSVRQALRVQNVRIKKRMTQAQRTVVFVLESLKDDQYWSVSSKKCLNSFTRSLQVSMQSFERRCQTCSPNVNVHEIHEHLSTMARAGKILLVSSTSRSTINSENLPNLFRSGNLNSPEYLSSTAGEYSFEYEGEEVTVSLYMRRFVTSRSNPYEPYSVPGGTRRESPVRTGSSSPLGERPSRPRSHKSCSARSSPEVLTKECLSSLDSCASFRFVSSHSPLPSHPPFFYNSSFSSSGYTRECLSYH